jgi:hypothetical protein
VATCEFCIENRLNSKLQRAFLLQPRPTPDMAHEPTCPSDTQISAEIDPKAKPNRGNSLGLLLVHGRPHPLAQQPVAARGGELLSLLRKTPNHPTSTSTLAQLSQMSMRRARAGSPPGASPRTRSTSVSGGASDALVAVDQSNYPFWVSIVQQGRLVLN